MLTVWLMQMTLLYGTLKISKSVLSKGIRNFKENRRNKKEIAARYSAELLDTKGNSLSGAKEFNKLDDVINWSQKYVKTEKPDLTIQKRELGAGEVLEPGEIKKVEKFDFNKESIRDLVNDFEKQNNLFNGEGKQKIKGEIFTHEDYKDIDKDIVTALYNGVGNKVKMYSDLNFNENLNKELDKQIKDLSKSAKFKYEGDSKYIGDKHDPELKLGYLQETIHNKSAFINYISEQRSLSAKSILPADFINQPIYENRQPISLTVKTAKKIKDFKMGVDRSSFHEQKSPRAMELIELKEWRNKNDNLIEAAKIFATNKGKYDKKNITDYIDKAIKFNDKNDKKVSAKTVDKFKLSPDKQNLNTSLKKNPSNINEEETTKRGVLN